MGNAYLVQGLRGNTLVAGKTTALRLITAPWPASGASAVVATIVKPDGSVASLTWTAAQIQVVGAGTATESVVVLIPGARMPDVGLYYVRAVSLSAIGAVQASYVIDAVELFPTRDLRMFVHRVWSGTGPAAKPNEVQAARDAMERLAALYPLRDGISTLDGDYRAGLRYNFDDDPQGPPSQDGGIAALWDGYQKPPIADGLDAAVMYRFPDAREGSGASTRPKYNGWLPNSLIVWQASLAQGFCHETGHNFGLEPKASPHFDPGGQAAHSRDEHVDANDAAAGFDIQFDRAFPVPTFDVMFPTGPSPGRAPETNSMNAWDWEYLRQKFLKLDSTGPHGPFIEWQNLGGHDLRAYPCAARNADGRLEVFVLGGDRLLYHIWEIAPGGAWHAWSTLAGHNLVGPILCATNADGRLQVFVRDGDGKIHTRSQSIPNGNWGPWASLGGSHVRGYAVARNADGRLEMVAVFDDGALHDIWQLTPNGAWSGWTPLQGHDLAGPVALAANADGRLEAFVVGGDGNVYHRWQSSPNGWAGWSGWANLIDPRLVRVTDLRAERAGDGRLFVVLMTVDHSISYLAQAVPNGDWGAAVDLYGHSLRWPCGLGRADDGRLEVAVIGGDQMLYSRWQVDPARSDLWVNWTPLGGTQIQAGVALAGNNTGQIEVFVVGGDGALYRGPRSG